MLGLLKSFNNQADPISAYPPKGQFPTEFLMMWLFEMRLTAQLKVMQPSLSSNLQKTHVPIGAKKNTMVSTNRSSYPLNRQRSILLCYTQEYETPCLWFVRCWMLSVTPFPILSTLLSLFLFPPIHVSLRTLVPRCDNTMLLVYSPASSRSRWIMFQAAQLGNLCIAPPILRHAPSRAKTNSRAYSTKINHKARSAEN